MLTGAIAISRIEYLHIIQYYLRREIFDIFDWVQKELSFVPIWLYSNENSNPSCILGYSKHVVLVEHKALKNKTDMDTNPIKGCTTILYTVHTPFF
jgi:hypothetical protein